MKLSLLVMDGPHAGMAIPLTGGWLVVGRGPQSHVRPNHAAVSLRHCALMLRGDRAFLRDLDSQAGTFLNDRQLRGEIELRDGDLVGVGPLSFVVHVEAGQAEAAAAPALDAAAASAEFAQLDNPGVPPPEEARSPVVETPTQVVKTPASLPEEAEVRQIVEAPVAPPNDVSPVVPEPQSEQPEPEPDIASVFERHLRDADRPPPPVPARPPARRVRLSESLPVPSEAVGKAPAAPAEPPKEGQLKLSCPECGTVGVVPWGRLNTGLCCSGCWTWFKLGPGGQLAKIPPPVRGAGTTLRHHAADGTTRTVQVPEKLLAEKRRAWDAEQRWKGLRRLGALLPLRYLAAAAVLALMVGSAWGVVRWRSMPAVVVLPKGLEERAARLSEAWLGRDAAVMARLTDPNQDRTMRRWSKDNPSPFAPGKFERAKTTIDVSVTSRGDDTAELLIRLRLPLEGPRDNLVLTQRWSRYGDQWFFDPAGIGPRAPPKQPVGKKTAVAGIP